VIDGIQLSIGAYPAEDRRWVFMALRAVQEWKLVKDGVSTYQQMGNVTREGGVPLHKQREYLLVDGLIGEALRDKRQG